MRVRLLTSLSDLRRAYQHGDTVDLADADARRLIDRGLAEIVRPVVTETTSLRRGERAVRVSGEARSGRQEIPQ